MDNLRFSKYYLKINNNQKNILNIDIAMTTSYLKKLSSFFYNKIHQYNYIINIRKCYTITYRERDEGEVIAESMDSEKETEHA